MEVQVLNLCDSNEEIQSLQEMHSCFIAPGKEDTMFYNIALARSKVRAVASVQEWYCRLKVLRTRSMNQGLLQSMPLP